MRVFRTCDGVAVERAGTFYASDRADWDTLINSADPSQAFTDLLPCSAPFPNELVAPIQSQEVWAAGVTYGRSREARIEESGTPSAAISTPKCTMRPGPSCSSKRRVIAW